MWKGRFASLCQDVLEIAPNVCGGHGTCDFVTPMLGKCTCSDFSVWSGVACEFPVCFGTPSNETGVCSGHGVCDGPNICNCTALWGHPVQDPVCSQPLCEGILSKDARVCSRHGQCSDSNVCACDFAFSGSACGEFDALGFSLVSQWYLWYLLLPFAVFILCFAVIVVIIAIIRLIIKQRKQISRYSGIDDIDVIITEQAAEKGVDLVAHLKVDKKLFQVDIDDVKIESVLGSGGSSSIVYAATWRGQSVAYKCFKLRDIVGSTKTESDKEESQKKYRDFEIELNLLANLNHPHIIRFYGAVLSPRRVGFLMELCSQGELKEFLQKTVDYAMEQKIRMMREIASAMDFLHHNNVIHRDLKCQNVLVTEEESTRLMDFGLSRKIEETSMASKTSGIGTSYYMAPEMVLGEAYTSKVDVFSFAIMMIEILTSKFNPYRKEGQEAMQFVEFKVANNPHFRPNLSLLPDDAPKWFENLIRMSWHHNAEKRPSFEEILRVLKSQESGVSSQSSSVVIYIRRADEMDGNAEDFCLMTRTMRCLRELVDKHFSPKTENWRLMHKKKEIRADSDIEALEKDCVLVLCFEDSRQHQQAVVESKGVSLSEYRKLGAKLEQSEQAGKDYETKIVKMQGELEESQKMQEAKDIVIKEWETRWEEKFGQ